MGGLEINFKDDTTKTEIFAIIRRVTAGTLHTDLIGFLGQRCTLLSYPANPLKPIRSCNVHALWCLFSCAHQPCNTLWYDVVYF